MHFLLLPLALYTIAQAAPIVTTFEHRRPLDDANEISRGDSRHVPNPRRMKDVGREAEALAENDASSGAGYDSLGLTAIPADTHIDVAPCRPITSASPDEPDAEDPELMKILNHVRSILDRHASTEEKIHWVVDAIIHPSESLGEEPGDPWSATEILDAIDNALTGEIPVEHEEREQVYDETPLHKKHEEKLRESVAESVISQITAAVCGQDSPQKKIKTILSDIVDHVNLEADRATTSHVPSQVILGK